jgi:hypothetical protein
MFYYSRDRKGEHPQAHLARYAGILQADAYDGYNQLYLAGRQPGPIQLPGCEAAILVPCYRAGIVASGSAVESQSTAPQSDWVVSE